MGKTRKPCPLCKRTESYPFREEDEVCNYCRDEVKILREIKVQVDALKDKTTYWLPSAYHDLPYFRPFDEFGESDRMKQDVIRRTFNNLVLAVSDRADGYPGDFSLVIPVSRTEHGPSAWHGIVVRMSPKVRELFITLYRAIMELSQDAYNEGKEDGSRILTQLATGAITTDQYEKQRKGQ